MSESMRRRFPLRWYRRIYRVVQIVGMRYFARSIGLVALLSSTVQAQHSHTGKSVAIMSDADKAAMAAHMEVTPSRAPTAAESARAAQVAAQLKAAIVKYRDVRAAEDDGFRMFAPQLKNQPVYHFTKNLWALENQFRFNPAKPTSLLYTKDPEGNFVLVGAMYTAPKRFRAAELDERIPTSVAQWHKHVNWCMPVRRQEYRWTEMKNGRPVFGPLGITTSAECEAAGGRFVKEVFGWMVHANVFLSEDPQMVWGDHHMRGDEILKRE